MSAPIRHEKPLGKIVFEIFDKKTETPLNICSHRKNITNYTDYNNFNFAVNVLVPKCDDLPLDLDNILTDHPAYLARQVSLGTLITEEFRGCFMQRGKVYALSYGTSIDSNDCLAILPSGMLVLHLTKDTFQELGLEGKASVFGNGTQKYVVEINMVQDDFNPGKKLYERVKWCLTNRLNLTFDLLFTWQPVVNHICPTSILNFFKEKNIVCNRVKITKKTNHFKSPLPRVNFSDPENKSEENCGYLDMFEWLGACAIGADLTDHSADSFISSYTCPTPSEKFRSCVGVQYQGMFTPQTVQKAVQCIREYMQEKNLPWCSVTVHGFADAPVTQKMHEHGFHNNGDNLCTYLIFPEGIWVFSALGDRDVYT